MWERSRKLNVELLNREARPLSAALLCKFHLTLQLRVTGGRATDGRLTTLGSVGAGGGRLPPPPGGQLAIAVPTATRRPPLLPWEQGPCRS
jgi:hypothetical protein